MNALNHIVAQQLRDIGKYLAMQKIAFKPRVYEKAAAAIDDLEKNISDMYTIDGIKALEKIPGVGVSIAEKIEEFLKTGHIAYYEELRKKEPVDLGELSRVEGLGPQSIDRFYKKLGVRNLVDLEKAARTGKIAKLEGFGKKSEEKILKGISFAKSSGGRFVLGFMMPEIRIIEDRLRKINHVEKVTVAGSVRRKKETVGDVDILVVSKKSALIMDYFVTMPEVALVIAHGSTKSSVKLKSGINIDLRVVSMESYGTALNYFTGSKEHNIALRVFAMQKGWKLNEYGLFKGKERIAGITEEELYKKFGMDYIEPELRENTGELETALSHKLPKLIGYKDLQGDLQIQTDWTDGSDSIEAMAKIALAHGLKYIAVTDHTKRLAMTNGLDEKRILQQMAEIDRLNKQFGGVIKILKGSECDVLKDGSLDLPDNILAKLDVVGVAIHSFFNLSKKDQTERIRRAMINPNVDILFHPTGRILNRRAAYDVDIDELITVAKKTGTIMEIDALPERLDLKDEYIRKCVDAGVKMAIDSDAHTPAHFDCLEYGIAQARRGWATKKDIINAWPLEKMMKELK